MLMYALLDENNHVTSTMEIPDTGRLIWEFPDNGRKVILTEQDLHADPEYELYDYIYDEELGEIKLDPNAVKSTDISYTDLETGEQVTMTQEEFDSMVDEKVRNNVVAVLQELADADAETIQQILNPQPKEVTP